MRHANTTTASGRRARKGLWRGHEATPTQLLLTFGIEAKRSQAAVLLDLLRRARAETRPVELPEIMAVGIAQHSARITELRERGFMIRNEMNRDPDGCIIRSRYWLEHDVEQDVVR